MWSIFKSKKQKQSDEYKDGMAKGEYECFKLFTPELISWVNNCNDAELLASAYCIINCWEWPDFMPPMPVGYIESSGGWGNKPGDPKDYTMIAFTQKLMGMLEGKAEKISPGLKQAIWMSKSYAKFPTQKRTTR